MTDIPRWKHRFQNFEQSAELLQRLLNIPAPSEGERMGIIQAFEISFELSWKLLNDYLTSIGFEVIGPKNILKQAFQSKLIENGHLWLEALENRNETSHTYNTITADLVLSNIRNKYNQEIQKLYISFKKRIQNES